MNNIEKFYEPFKTIEECENYLGKNVIIDGKVEATFEVVYLDSNKNVRVKFIDLDKNEYEMYLLSAFQRIKIDNHRFGKEITD